MKGLIATAVAGTVLFVAAASAGAAPPGFWRSARLAPAATFVAGKPVAVYCAPTQAAINQTVSADATSVLGATPMIGSNEIYLAPITCAYLNAWLNGKKVANLYGVAVAMETLAHEAELARGSGDETTATCLGLRAMPKMVTKFFPLKKRESLHDLIGDAYSFWETQSSLYHAHSC
jgi:hypothetical protein